MKRFILAVVPMLLAALTFYFSKPSEEKCRKVASERLSTINVYPAQDKILVKDYAIMRVLKLVMDKDTLPLGSGFFFMVRVNDKKLKNIQEFNKPTL